MMGTLFVVAIFKSNIDSGTLSTYNKVSIISQLFLNML